MHLDIGGGTNPQSTINLDPVHGNGQWKRSAQDVPWPADDDSFKVITASHVMEHIPAGSDRIAVMNEAWRVLRPGGRFHIKVPLFPHWSAIADPTHVSFWVPESFSYFDGSWKANADYGMKLWQTLDFTVRDGWEGHWIGMKPKT